MSRQMNRRAVLAGAAVAMPAAAIGAPPALESPEAELIALGEKLRVAWAAERRACPPGKLGGLCDGGHIQRGHH